MTEPDDDLSRWDDAPLVRALREPGTPAELAGEQEMVAAYRSAMRAGAPGSLRRVVGRLGVGGSAVVATVALTSGVAAAAYTGLIPTPVQRAAHALVPLVPAPTPDRTIAAASTPTARASTRAGTGPIAVVTPQTHPTPPVVLNPTSAPSGTPQASSEPSPSLSAPPSPSPTFVRLEPAAVSITVSKTRVRVYREVTVSGVVTASDGQPLRGRAVALVGRTPGTPGWTRLAWGKTDRDGSVSLPSGPLGETTLLRLHTRNHVTSDRLRVVVVPRISATSAGGSIDVTTQGGRSGDTVVLFRVANGTLRKLAESSLDVSGSTSFTVQPRTHKVRYVLRLRRTALHAAATTSLVLDPSGSG